MANETTTDDSQNGEPRKNTKRKQFLLRRMAARKRAMQFLYGLDLQRSWSFTDEQLQNFKEMLTDLEEDTETLADVEFEKAMDYMKTLIGGVTEHIEEIDSQIRAAARNWRLERMEPVDRCIIRVAVFEMAHVEGIIGPIAINEAVELSKSFGRGDAPRFVNGVLDRVWRSIAKEKGLDQNEGSLDGDN